MATTTPTYENPAYNGGYPSIFTRHSFFIYMNRAILLPVKEPSVWMMTESDNKIREEIA